MAHDLLFGKTGRDWTIGQFPHVPADKSRLLAQDVLADEQVPILAKAVGEETQTNYNRIVHLSADNRMPTDLRKEFGKYLRRWYDFRAARGGLVTPKLTGKDFVELSNLRDLNRTFTARLDALERSPATYLAPTPAALPNGQSAPLLKLTLLNLAIGLAGLAGMAKIAQVYRTKAEKI